MKSLILCITLPLFAQISVLESIDSLELLLKEQKRKYSAVQIREMEAALEQKNVKLRVVSYNILFNKFDHRLDQEYRWPDRKYRLMKMIRNLKADVIGIQELYPRQRDDMLSHLQNQYTFFAKPCKDGELNGILFRRSRFILTDSYVWHLSDDENPRARTLTMVRLRDRRTGKEFAVFNTHLAFFDINMRSYEGMRIGQIIDNYIEEEEIPVILTGDMNTYPNFPQFRKQPFYDGDYVDRLVRGKYLSDARNRALFGHFGPLSTFSNKGEDHTPFRGHGNPGVFLDHIYVSPDICVLVHAIDPSTINGYFPSDHLPLITDIVLRGGA